MFEIHIRQHKEMTPVTLLMKPRFPETKALTTPTHKQSEVGT